MTPRQATKQKRSGLGALPIRLAQATRSNPIVAIQIAFVLFVLARIALDGQIWVLWQWALFATHALVFPIRMADVDGFPTLLASLSYGAKLLLGLTPAAVLFACAPKWRILTCVYAAGILMISVSFVRACPSWSHWIALGLLSALGVALLRYRYQRWAIALPMIVLLVIPASQHGSSWLEGANLASRCAANDGQRAQNVSADQFAARYYGAHYFPPDWVLLTGETPDEGKFMGLPHGGRGSWWLRKEADGQLSFAGPSWATGNIWTSCLLGDDGWLVRAGFFLHVRPPGPDGRETVQRIPFSMDGFDAPDTACDERTDSVYASDLHDGRLLELSPQTRGKPVQRSDRVSVRGGLMSVRKGDGRLVMLDFQDLIVYATAESRVLQKTPAAIASSSLALCQSDGAVAVPDLAGRLRVFRMRSDGTYAFDWGISLFAPRFATFSPDCSYIGVTSANDRDVWIIDRSSRQIIKSFRVGPALRGATFIGPRELVVVDACTLSALRF